MGTIANKEDRPSEKRLKTTHGKMENASLKEAKSTRRDGG